jgi:serine/threonine protein kinase
VVHRDIKPSNILVDEQGRPHLADFGVATARDLTVGLTEAGTAVGTPGFVAPEQARGEVAGAAADLFSLGATLRWAATGAGPYGEGPWDVLLLRAVRGKVEPCPRTIPAHLRRRIDRMLTVRRNRPERRQLRATPAPVTRHAGHVGRRSGSARRRWHRRRRAAGAPPCPPRQRAGKEAGWAIQAPPRRAVLPTLRSRSHPGPTAGLVIDFAIGTATPTAASLDDVDARRSAPMRPACPGRRRRRAIPVGADNFQFSCTPSPSTSRSCGTTLRPGARRDTVPADQHRGATATLRLRERQCVGTTPPR